MANIYSDEQLDHLLRLNKKYRSLESHLEFKIRKLDKRIEKLEMKLRMGAPNSLSLKDEHYVLSRDRNFHERHLKQVEAKLENIEIDLVQEQQIFDTHASAFWCANYHRQLPREIRDMVYAFLLPPPMTYTIEPDPRKQRRNPRAYRALCNGKEVTLEDFLTQDREVLGEAIIREWSEIFYKQARWHVTSLELIPNLLRYDAFDINVDPLKTIRRLELVLSTGSQHLKAGLEPPLYRAARLRCLKPLLSLERKAAISIHLQHEKWLPRAVLELLHDIVPWIIRVKERGIRLSVSTILSRGRVEFMDFVGDSLDEFDEWVEEWPENESDFKKNKAFLNSLVG